MSTHSRIASKLHRLDLFITATVVTVVSIRLFLELTGYPQIGGGGLHIAHMLWGGLLMLAVILYVLLSDAPNKMYAAVSAGIGFGIFIDEVGKFVTANNNYFFQPTIFIIYITLLVIWFTTRTVIVKKNKLPLLSSATWPQHYYQRIFILLFGVTHVVIGAYSVFLYIQNGWTIFNASHILGLLCAIALFIVTLSFIAAIWNYARGYVNRSAYSMRIGSLLLLTVVYPFIFLYSVYWALLGGFATILVAIGLSTISLHSLFLPLFKDPH